MLCSLNMMGTQEHTSLLCLDLRHFSLTYSRLLFYQRCWPMGLNLILLNSEQSRVCYLLQLPKHTHAHANPDSVTPLRTQQHTSSVSIQLKRVHRDVLPNKHTCMHTHTHTGRRKADGAKEPEVGSWQSG